MPYLVRVSKGDDPRAIHEKLADSDAHDLAKKISAATGEEVELVPYHYDEKTSSWVLADEPSTTIQIAPSEETGTDAATATTDVPDFDAMKGAALDKYAADHNIDGYKKSDKVVDRRKAVVKWFKAQAEPAAEPSA